MRRIFIGLALVVAAAACTKDYTSPTAYTPPTAPPPPPGKPVGPPPAPVAPTMISITDKGYIPAIMSLPAGVTVRWTNNGSRNHTVTSPSAGFDSGDIAPGGTFTFTFALDGTFPYTDKDTPPDSTGPGIRGEMRIH